MHNHRIRLHLTVVLASVALAFFQLERAAEAQTSPAPDASPPAAASPSPTPVPASSPTPKAFNFRGYVRAYDFTRQNASGFPSTANQLNQHSFNMGTGLHVDYTFGRSGFSIGGSYFYANPFNGCADPRSTAFKCATLTPAQALLFPEHLNPDTTLPAYSLSTFYEAYIQYSKNGLFAKVGDQVINTPWTPVADTRLKPIAYQGADLAYRINQNFTVEVMDMDRFQFRTTSDFLRANLLTGVLTELPHGGGPPISAAGQTGGFQNGRLSYTSKNLTSNFNYYHFLDIANLAWLDGRYTFSGTKIRPFIGAQVLAEKSTGAAILGKVNSQVYGLQLGATILKNVVLTMAADVIPRHVENLPAGVTCPAATRQITPAQTFPNPSAGFFVPLNAPQCIPNPNGTVSVEYGGVASPYTDSTAADPLYTTSLTQGMVDRRAPGSSEKVALTYTSSDKRLVLYVSRAYYDYGFNNFPDQTNETDGDATYYLRPFPPRGPYRGLMVRWRYGVRTDNRSSALNFPAGYPAAFFGSLPYFVYNRAQLQYDF